MSTYAIAGAIEKFADNFIKAIREKNAIEKEKLAFEKEKFEFEKKKEECENEEECEHEWELTRVDVYSDGIVNHYACSKCGEELSSSLGI